MDNRSSAYGTRSGAKAPHDDDAASLAVHIQHFGPWGLVTWRPRGGFTHRDYVDLQAVRRGLERKQ
ncbi:hypothetical protein ABZ626_23420 [Streptomyces longispororuber]|uniref:hypothetical protein n=1 Tax=Streptomyces longispororuber TaxID=68230 RepID=UPI0033C4DF67